MTDAIKINISNEEYHADKALSRSALWAFRELPSKYYYQYLSGEYVEKEKKCFDIGQLYHTLILEPHLLEERFLIVPKVDRRTKDGKAKYAAYMASLGNRIMINDVEFAEVKAMKDELLKDETAQMLFAGQVEIEQSIFWTDPESGLRFKCRPDVINGPVLGDLKSSQNARPRDFQRDATTKGYFLQAAMNYLATQALGEPFKKFIFVAQEKFKPYAPAFYIVSDDAIEYGLKQFRKLVDEYMMCLEKNFWPHYGVQLLDTPKWADFEELNTES